MFARDYTVERENATFALRGFTALGEYRARAISKCHIL